MATKATEVRKGNVLKIDGELWLVIEREHIAPGNWRAINHFKLRNMATGSRKDLRCGSNDPVTIAFMDKRKCQYLYKDEGKKSYIFMDNENYEQYELAHEVVGEQMVYVVEEQQIEITFHDENPVMVELPSAVVLEVTEADIAVKGNSVSNIFKRAVVQTGLEIKVPLHISAGEKVKINTDTGEFMGRAK